MNENVVYFAHGKESGPWGIKIKRLAEIARALGCCVESPDYSSILDPDERVRMLMSLKPGASKHLILVGSSMGGYVSAVASKDLKVSGLFLLAPAMYRAGYAHSAPKPHAGRTIIIHGWKDDVIPPENSIRYAREFKIELYLVVSDHRLVEALPTIENLFHMFLNDILQESDEKVRS